MAELGAGEKFEAVRTKTCKSTWRWVGSLPFAVNLNDAFIIRNRKA